MSAEAQHPDDWSDDGNDLPQWDEDEESAKKRERRYTMSQVVSGFGLVEGGPQLAGPSVAAAAAASASTAATAPARARVIPDPEYDPEDKKHRSRPKDESLRRAGFGLLTGGPRGPSMRATVVPSGHMSGGPPAAKPLTEEMMQLLRRGAPSGLQPSGPSGYAARDKWRRATAQVLAERRHGKHPGGPPQPRLVFGVPLDDLLDREGGRIPYLITACFSYLARDEYKACKQVGIFRLSGATSDVDRLVEAFNWGRKVQLDKVVSDPIAVAALVKLFLRQLPTSLVIPELNEEMMKLFFSRTLTVESAVVVLKKMARSALDLYMEINIFLNTVATFVELNKMGTPNLAIVIGPNTLRLPNLSPLEEISKAGQVAEVSQFFIDYALYLAEALEAQGYGPYGRTFDGSAYAPLESNHLDPIDLATVAMHLMLPRGGSSADYNSSAPDDPEDIDYGRRGEPSENDPEDIDYGARAQPEPESEDDHPPPAYEVYDEDAAGADMPPPPPDTPPPASAKRK